MVQSCFVGMILFDVQSSASKKTSMNELFVLRESPQTSVGTFYFVC